MATDRFRADLALRHPRGRTAIRVGDGALAEPNETVSDLVRDRAVFSITTPRLLELHGDRLVALERAAGRWRTIETRDGEGAKRLGVAERIWREMLEHGGKRDSCVVAFGGGTVGDLAGFVAGAFLRGVDWLGLPTTLLAQVDAAIGGKTGVNLPEAKNSVGLFHHPLAVVCDTEILTTLDPAELRSGLFEVVKIAAIRDAELLRTIDGSLEHLLAGDPAALAPVVARAVEAKVSVVEADPEEGDTRRLLNFGHTLGHALEAVLDFRGLRHGEAVGYGMLFATRLAERRGLAAEDAAALRDLIGRVGLPELPVLAVDGLLERVARDKKARESGIAWVYPQALGTGVVDPAIGMNEVSDLLADFLRDPWLPGR